MKDYYGILQISKNASAEEITEAYRRIASANHPHLHPDNRNAENTFREAAEAYAVLSDPDRKNDYDNHSLVSPENMTVTDILKKFGNIIGPAPERKTASVKTRRHLFSLIDKYIIKKFIVTTIFAHCIIIAIAIVIDFSEKTDDFVKKGASSQAIFVYYLDFIPYIGALLAPLLIFIAVIFFTSRMAANTEVIPILNGGASFRRFLRPYFFCGILFSAILLVGNHWLVPELNKSRYSFEEKYIRSPVRYGNNIHLRIDPQTLVSLERFKYENNEGTTFSLERYEGSDENKHLVYKINAGKIIFLPDQKKWRIVDYKKWEISGDREIYLSGRQMDTVLNMKPSDFSVDEQLKEALNYQEIDKFIKTEEQKGAADMEDYVVEQYRRTSSAISVLILTIMGAALASRKIRGGTGFHLALGVGLSSLYVVFLQFSSTFSIKGGLPPLIGTNIPNIIFGFVAVLMIRFASR